LKNDSTNVASSPAHSSSIFDLKTDSRKELDAKMAQIALTFEDGDVEFMDKALARDKARRTAKRASLLATAPHFSPTSSADVPAPEKGNKQELELEADDPQLVCIQKVDARSGRPYWVNLKTKVTSWTPPDGWNALSAVILPRAVAISSAAETASGANVVVTKAAAAPAVAGPASSRKSGRNPMSAFHFVADDGRDSPPPPPPSSPPPSPPLPPLPDDWC
jgi:hypothetical protein